eukprot:855767-Prorocentrum_minimum.AAC.8
MLTSPARAVSPATTAPPPVLFSASAAAVATVCSAPSLLLLSAPLPSFPSSHLNFSCESSCHCSRPSSS